MGLKNEEIKKHITVEKHSESDRQTELCPLLRKPPLACNPYPKRRYCRLTRHLYVAGHAHKTYLALRTESRERFPLTKEQFCVDDKIISEGIRKGQHLYHIIQTHYSLLEKNEQNKSTSSGCRTTLCGISGVKGETGSKSKEMLRPNAACAGREAAHEAPPMVRNDLSGVLWHE